LILTRGSHERWFPVTFADRNPNNHAPQRPLTRVASLTEERAETTMNIQKMAEQVKENIGQVIVGEDKVIKLALVALLGELQQ